MLLIGEFVRRAREVEQMRRLVEKLPEIVLGESANETLGRGTLSEKKFAITVVLLPFTPRREQNGRGQIMEIPLQLKVSDAKTGANSSWLRRQGCV